MSKLLITLFLLLPVVCIAQYTISGKVLNHDDKKPIADASVFLNNAVVGTKTSNDGAFALTGVRPGQYEVVVSIIGYETVHQNINVIGDVTLPDIEMNSKAIVLNEVKIKSNNNWERDYDIFKGLFLGVSENATDCKILNPEQLDLDYDPVTGIMKARSYDFLEIENKALGYKIKYLLTSLENNPKADLLYFEGSLLFEEMKGRPAEERRWKKNRLATYMGSTMHFLRAVVGDNMKAEGFKVLRLIRAPNPNYKGGFDNKYIQTLVKTPLDEADFVKLTDVKGRFALGFSDCLYVIYGKKIKDEKDNEQSGTPYYNNAVATTIIFKEPYAFFDLNGTIINPRSLIFDGNWGRNRIAEMLPVDYVPTL